MIERFIVVPCDLECTVKIEKTERTDGGVFVLYSDYKKLEDLLTTLVQHSIKHTECFELKNIELLKNLGIEIDTSKLGLED